MNARVDLGIAAAGYLILLAGSAALSAFQVALLSIRRSRVAQLVESGNAAARQAEPLVERPEPFMIASRIALVVAGAGATVGAAMLPLLLLLVRLSGEGLAVELFRDAAVATQGCEIGK